MIAPPTPILLQNQCQNSSTPLQYLCYTWGKSIEWSRHDTCAIPSHQECRVASLLLPHYCLATVGKVIPICTQCKLVWVELSGATTSSAPYKLIECVRLCLDVLQVSRLSWGTIYSYLPEVLLIFCYVHVSNTFDTWQRWSRQQLSTSILDKDGRQIIFRTNISIRIQALLPAISEAVCEFTENCQQDTFARDNNIRGGQKFCLGGHDRQIKPVSMLSTLQYSVVLTTYYLPCQCGWEKISNNKTHLDKLIANPVMSELIWVPWI